jgi:hypothetical protein
VAEAGESGADEFAGRAAQRTLDASEW